jgi:hypothetical protein
MAAGTVTHDYGPTDTVWVVVNEDGCDTVKTGVVDSVAIGVVQNTDTPPVDVTTISYTITVDNRKISVLSTKTFADVDAALADLRVVLTS